MKVVVTGGSGRVGRHVIACLARDHQVVNADLAPPAHGLASADVPFVKADVMQIDALREAFKGADAVIHLAGLDYDWGCPGEDYINVNTRGSWHALQAAEDAGVKRVVLCSSIAICGLQEMRPDWKPQSLPIVRRVHPLLDQLTCLVALGPRIRESDGRILTNGVVVLFSGNTVLQPPQARTVRFY